jgi:hypothetical protein
MSGLATQKHIPWGDIRGPPLYHRTSHPSPIFISNLTRLGTLVDKIPMFHISRAFVDSEDTR